MPSGKFSYDEGSDTWSDPDQPELGQVTLEEATDGRFFNIGREVRYRGTGRIVGRIAFLAGSELTVTDAGAVFLENNVRGRELNQSDLESGLYSSTVRGTYRDEVLGDVHIESDYISLTPLGERLYVPEGGITDPAQFATFGPTDQVPAGMRLATPNETLMRGAIGFLVRNHRDLLQRLADQGLGGPSATGKGAIYRVAAILAADLELVATITYDLTGRIGL